MAIPARVEDRDLRTEILRKHFNLEHDQLINAVIVGEQARTSCDATHPPLYRGLRFWGETTSALRKLTAASGYQRRDTVGFATALNTDLGVAIAVVSGDDATGLRTAEPKSKYRKGTITIAAVEQNAQQLTFFGVFDREERIDQDELENDGVTTWLLLVTKDPAQKEIRVELSLPARMTDDSKVSGFVHRIFLDSLPYGGSAIDDGPPSQPPPAIDVPVERI